MYWGPDSREPHYTRSDRCTSIPVHPERQSWLKLSLPWQMSFRLAFGCVCMMKCWIVVTWGKMIQPWKPSPEVVGRLWDNFWAQTHLIWRGIHRQNEFFSSCLDVFENSNFCFFRNSLCRSRPNLSPGKSARVIQDNFWVISRYVSLRICWPKIASYSQKKVFENFVRKG